jgi:hypothetical protein
MRGHYKAAIAAASRKHDNRNTDLGGTDSVQILAIAFGLPIDRIVKDILILRQREFIKNARHHANLKFPLPS